MAYLFLDHPLGSKLQKRKYLLGISATGYVCFISQGFPSTTSNLDMLYESGFLDKLQKEDIILGSKSFIEDIKCADSDIGCYQKMDHLEISPILIEQTKLRQAIEMMVFRTMQTGKPFLNLFILKSICKTIFIGGADH